MNGVSPYHKHRAGAPEKFPPEMTPRPKVKIPRVTSVPATLPAKASFLTLPPEIRNSIYSLLFESPDPIRVAGCFCYEYRRDPSLRTKVPGISLMLTCRQIYHECVSVLYTENTFTLYTVLKSYEHVFHLAEHWFEGIGTQFRLLRKVLLTFNFDWLKMSTLNLTNFVTKLQEAGPILQIEIVTNCNSDRHRRCLENFNHVLNNLRLDTLSQKPFRRLLLSIRVGIFLDYAKGQYNFSPYCDDIKYFALDPSTKMIKFTRKPPTLVNLHPHLRQKILEMAMYQEEDGRLDCQTAKNLRLVSKQVKHACSNFLLPETIRAQIERLQIGR